MFEYLSNFCAEHPALAFILKLLVIFKFFETLG